MLKIYNNSKATKEGLISIKAIINRYNEITDLNNLVSNFSSIEKLVLRYVYSKEDNYENAFKIFKNIHLLSVQVYINNLENNHKAEIELINNFDFLTKEIREAMEEKINEVPKLINLFKLCFL